MDKNLHWVNAVRILCMVLVFFNHSEIYCNYYIESLDKIYLPFFVNAFFFVSGYLLFRKQLNDDIICLRTKDWMSNWGGQYLLNILFKLVIPSLFFAFIIYFPKVYLRGMEFSENEFIADTLLGRSTWFTSALTVAQLLIFVLLLFRIKNIWFYIVSGIILLLSANYIYDTGIVFYNDKLVPWHYKAGMSAVVVLAFGGLYSIYEDKIDSCFRGYRIIPLIILFFICAFLCKDNVCLNWGPITIRSLSLIILGSYCFVRLCKLLPQNKFVDYWGVRSISLYFLCGSFPNAYAILFGKIMAPSYGLLLVVFTTSFITVVGAAYVLNEYLPFVYDLRKIKNKKK